jgi:hypothetical protein
MKPPRWITEILARCGHTRSRRRLGQLRRYDPKPADATEAAMTTTQETVTAEGTTESGLASFRGGHP